MKTKKQEDDIQINLPKETIKILDKMLKSNPDFESKEFLIFYCVRRYFEDGICNKNKSK